MLSVILLQYNNHHLTKNAIESFEKWCDCEHEIILIDNASPDIESRHQAKELKNIHFVQNSVNEGFGMANNQGAKIAKGNVLLFLNNDTISQSDFVTPIMEMFKPNSGIGIIGPQLLNRDQTCQISSGALPTLWQELKDKILYSLYDKKYSLAELYAKTNLFSSREVGWVSGAALFIDRSLFDAIGGFDDKMFMYFEDKDLCLRTYQAGKKVYYDSDASLIHIGSGSAEGKHVGITERFYRSSQMYYYCKHRSMVEQMLLKYYFAIGKRKYYDR
jgi:GT2 family glycosyltransferase